MTNEERIVEARRKVKFYLEEVIFFAGRDGWDSSEVSLWVARWVAAKEIFELLTGEKLS